MKALLLIGLLFIFDKVLEFAVTAQDAQVEGQVDKLLMNLQASALDPELKLKAAWQLGLIGTAAKKSVPALVKILVTSDEHPKARMSALNTVGASAPTPQVSVSEASRVQQLDAIAQRIRAGSGSPNPTNQSSPPPRVISAEAQPDGIALMSEEGRLFVGHQLEFFETTGDGVLSTSKPAWISLYRTEGRDFTLSGEVSLGGAYNQMLFPGDLPDGFALFLREWDGVQRYQLDSRRMMVKRRLLNGHPVSDIQTIVEFSPPPLGEWAPFHVRLSRDVIEYSFAGVVSRLIGPVDIDGANKLTIAPGTRIKNLRLSIDGTSDRSPFVDNPPEGPRMTVGPPPPQRPLPRFTQPPPQPSNDLETKMHKVWQLSFENSSNQEAITDLMKLLEDATESPPVRRAVLNALGHLGITNESIMKSIWTTIEKSPEVFALSKDHRSLNGGFEFLAEAGKVDLGGRPPVGSSFDFAAESGRGDLRGAFGETMFAPGSGRLTGWSIYEGPITLRDNLPSPAGGRVIELGPREVPGCVSQTIRTAVGQQYELKFYTCTGRGEFHFNRQIRIRVADLDETIDCPVGAEHELMHRQFRAVSPLTTISICGVGNAGFGPILDGVQIERK